MVSFTLSGATTLLLLSSSVIARPDPRANSRSLHGSRILRDRDTEDSGICVPGPFMDPVDKQFCEGGGEVASTKVALQKPIVTAFSSSDAPDKMNSWYKAQASLYGSDDGFSLKKRAASTTGAADAALAMPSNLMYKTTLSGTVDVFVCGCNVSLANHDLITLSTF